LDIIATWCRPESAALPGAYLCLSARVGKFADDPVLARTRVTE
jgi:hypothetical protein